MFEHNLVYTLAIDQGGLFLCSDIRENTNLHEILIALALADLCDWGLITKKDGNQFCVL